MQIAIIGAGLGGLCAAAVLQRQGHAVRVYEQSATLGEVGAGIQMSANAMKVLDALGLRPALEPVAVRPKAFEFRRFDSGDLLHRLPLGDVHEQRHGAPYFQLHRADLHAALLMIPNMTHPAAPVAGPHHHVVHVDRRLARFQFRIGYLLSQRSDLGITQDAGFGFFAKEDNPFQTRQVF